MCTVLVFELNGLRGGDASGWQLSEGRDGGLSRLGGALRSKDSHCVIKRGPCGS
jgi:hypothetical protein